MPVLLVSTRPSGSTRLTVASLYSFPASVLKSSEKATDTNGRIKTKGSFVFTYLNWTLPFCSHIRDPLVKENSSADEVFLTRRQQPTAINLANSSQATVIMSF